MKDESIKEKISSAIKYFVFKKEFSGPRASVLALLLIPLVAYPLVLSDYETTATVSSSSDQFEADITNNSDTIQVTPNAEIVIVKQVVNDDGGNLLLTDFSLATDAGGLIFDAGSTAGNTNPIISSCRNTFKSS